MLIYIINICRVFELMVTATTAGIKVCVSTDYQSDYSNPNQVHHVFSYKIEIENHSNHAIQVLRRHWFIDDITYYTKEVEGEGIVGLQPTIEPGDTHRYVSTCVLKTGIGRMRGYYLVERVMDGKYFEVEIPEFQLVADYRLN